MVWCFGLVLALLYKLKAFLWSWDELVVRVGSLTSNPSLPLALYTISPLKGSSGCVILPGERVIGAMGCGKWVWDLKGKNGEEASMALHLSSLFHFIWPEI
ncbi:hypothetical protein Tco_0063226 [Tanacetum coccineum]